MISCIKVLDDGTAIEVNVPDTRGVPERPSDDLALDLPTPAPRINLIDGGLRIREDALADAVHADTQHSAQGPEARIKAVLEALFGKVDVRS